MKRLAEEVLAERNVTSVEVERAADLDMKIEQLSVQLKTTTQQVQYTGRREHTHTHIHLQRSACARCGVYNAAGAPASLRVSVSTLNVALSTPDSTFLPPPSPTCLHQLSAAKAHIANLTRRTSPLPSSPPSAAVPPPSRAEHPEA